VPGGSGFEDEVEGLDEEFVYHLSRGSDLLSRGEAAEARRSLQRAAQLRPKDGKVLGLLGQACYRMGQFDAAAEAYGRLVDDNPAEVAARVNLGLAQLKARRFPEAEKQFRIALDLNPDHKKAMGYLGLAHFESGDFRGAREWFDRAGSLMMVARCDEVLAAGEALPAAPPPAAVEEPEPEPIRDPPVPVPVEPANGLGAYAARRTVRIPGESFAVEGRVLSITVRGEMLARLDGLFAVQGTLALTPEMKRFRGKPTDRPFGEGAALVHRATGEGALLYRATGSVFTTVDLAGEAGYFREEAVFALEEPVGFENGRVASKHSRDVNLVHLRGSGRFLLRTSGEPVALEVTKAAPLRVPVDSLIGWTGAVTPRIVPLASNAEEKGDGAEEGFAVVELSGDGRALIDPDAPAAAWGGRA